MRRGADRQVARAMAGLVAVVVSLFASGLALVVAAGPASADLVAPTPTPPFTIAAKGIAEPRGIAAGPDGNLWFVDRLTDSVVRSTPAGALTFFTDWRIENPRDLTAGPDGNLWFTTESGCGFAAGNGCVMRMTPAGYKTAYAVAGWSPQALAFASDGTLWFTAPNRVGKMTPAGVVTSWSPYGELNDIAVAPDGNAWVTARPDGVLLRVTPAGVVTEVPTGAPSATSITTGPDGALWFTVTASPTNEIGRITTDGTVTRFPTPGIAAKTIVTGGDGNLWFTNPGYGAVGKITTAGVVTNYVRTGINNVSSVAWGPDGKVWFTSAALFGVFTTGSIGRLNADGTGITIFRGDQIWPGAITRGDGAMWFTNPGLNSISKITDDGTVTRFAGSGIQAPASLAVGSDGNVWFTGAPTDAIGRLTPAGVITSFSDPAVVDPRDLVLGSDGAIWFATSGSTIGRITTAGTITTFSDPAVPAVAGLTLGPDGNLWFGAAPDLLGRITPAGVITTIPTGETPGRYSMTFGSDGNLWYTSYEEIGRITLAGEVTHYAVTSGVGAIVPGPDGALWFACGCATMFGRITTEGVVTYVNDDRFDGQGGLAFSGNGRLWVTSPNRSIAWTTPGAAPTAPPRLPAATAGHGNATVSWLPPASGPAATSYLVIPYLDGVAKPSTSTASTSATIYGLTPGKTYTFRVAGVNAAGAGPLSASTPPLVISAPGRPTGPTASPGNASATVSWVAPPVNGGAITGYVVTPFVNGYPRPPTTFNSSATTQTVTGLVQGVSYQFNVAAINALGTGAASALTTAVKVGTPKAAGTVAASPEDGGAKVSLFAPNSNGSPITGYTVTPYLGAVAQPAQTFVGPATVLTLTGLTNGSTYTFRIAATNAVGTGPPSAATAAIVVGAPKAVAAPTVSAGPGAGEATVSWVVPVDNGALVTGFVVQPTRNGVVQPSVSFDNSSTVRTFTGLISGASYTFRVAAINARGTGPFGGVSATVVPT